MMRFYKQSMKNSFVMKITLVLFLLNIPHLLFAAPVKGMQLDQNMQLAMLELNRSIAQSLSDDLASKGNSAGQAKISLEVEQPAVFPADCMTWNIHQINQKASKHHVTINKYAKKHNVDVNLIKSVITAESCFKTKALSHAGAQGLMQLIPETAKRFGVRDSYDPKSNIRGGVTYLRFLLDRYKGNLEKTIAAYNAGEGKVDQYKGIPPYKETKQYVKNVLKVYAMLSPHKVGIAGSNSRVKAIYYPPSLGQKPGRHGWQYNRSIAPHLYKQITK